MSIKYHKIRTVDKSICTAEQKIAYELAFRLHISYQDSWNAMKSRSVSEMCLSNAINDLIGEATTMFQRSEWATKFDIDGTICALRAGLRNYLDGFFIATSYEQIGKAFPAHYLK